MNKQKILLLLAAFLFLLHGISFSENGKIEEIKEYFELRDTISLVNLEMKRALARDSRSPMLLDADTEKRLHGLMTFIENRIQQIAQGKAPLRFHYRKKLTALFNETRQLHKALVVKRRTMHIASRPDSTIATGTIEKGMGSSLSGKDYQKPFFLPIDLRTLLSPALINSGKLPVKQIPVSIPEATQTISISEKNEKTESVMKTEPERVQVKSAPVKAVASESVKIVKLDIPVPDNANIKPEPVIARPEPAVVKPEPVAVKPEPVIAKPEPVVIKPEPAASETVQITTVEKVPEKPAQPDSDVAASGTVTFMRPLAVMIENHNRSRPQTGLDQADLVYEVPVEGGITRFMAIYTSIPKILGPVRSCREYFIDRALEADALYVHCGASPLGYAYIAKSKINSVDEIKNSKPFFRDKTRKAPHNLYTKGKPLYDYMAQKVPMQLKARPAIFPKIKAPAKGDQKVAVVKIRYHGNYNLEIKYENGVYQRYMNGVLHIDRVTQKALRFENFILQIAAMKTVDKAGRQDIDFIGKGTGWYFYGGTMKKITWHKAGPRSLTVYKDLSGNEISFSQKAPLWVQVVSPSHKLYFDGREVGESAAGVAKASPDKGKINEATASESKNLGKQG